MQDLRKHWRTHDSQLIAPADEERINNDNGKRLRRKKSDSLLLAEFVQDIKMQRLNPDYDDLMASTLTHLGEQFITAGDDAMFFDNIDHDETCINEPNQDQQIYVDGIGESSMELDRFLEELYLKIQDDVSAPVHQLPDTSSNLEHSNPAFGEQEKEDSALMDYLLDYEAGDQHHRIEAIKQALMANITVRSEDTRPEIDATHSYPATLIRSLTLKQSLECSSTMRECEPTMTIASMDRPKATAIIGGTAVKAALPIFKDTALNCNVERAAVRARHMRTIKLIMERLEVAWNR